MSAHMSTEPAMFLSVAEAAMQLGVNAATIRRWIRDGHLAAIQPGGPEGVLRIPTIELERLIDRAREGT
jgi:excisionase family DNA binding protein